MRIDQTTLEKMNILANGFANERVDTEINKIVSQFTTTEGLPAVDVESMKKNIGRILAMSYSKGYADCYENKDLKRLIF